MGRLKPREARLLIVFILALVVVASVFFYGIYQDKKAAVEHEIAQLETMRNELYAYRAMQAELNEKIVWLNQNQPVAVDELKANEYLDSLVSIGAVQAEGLTYLNTREAPPTRETYYWAFERTITMEGTIQQIVSFLSKLQSETSFRAITKLHIRPPKKTEPEILRCEFTVQQRYATPEVIAMTTPGMASATLQMPPRGADADGGGSEEAGSPAGKEGSGTEEDMEEASVETSDDPDETGLEGAPPPNPSTSVESTVRPPNGEPSEAEDRRPSVRLPRPASGVVPPSDAGAPPATAPTRPRITLPPASPPTDDEP